MDFIIDTAGDEELIDKEQNIGEVNTNEFDDVSQDTLAKILLKIKLTCDEIIAEEEKETQIENKFNRNKTDDVIDNFFKDMKWGHKIGEKKIKKNRKKDLYNFKHINMKSGKFVLKAANVDIEKELKKTVLTPAVEKDFSLPEYDMSDRRKKAIRKAERDKTKGPSWYNLPAPEITEELKNDLQMLKMRSVLDPKHFYKKNDMEVLPKYFQVGTIMDSPLDHLNERLTKKQRKRTIVDELLDDAEFNRYNKRKYTEIIEDKKKTTWKTYIKEKRLKRKEEYKKKKGHKQKKTA